MINYVADFMFFRYMSYIAGQHFGINCTKIFFVSHLYVSHPYETAVHLFEPTCAFCTTGSYALLSVCLDLTKVLDLGLWSLHICKMIEPSSLNHPHGIYIFISKIMLVTCENHRVGSLPTSSCISRI